MYLLIVDTVIEAAANQSLICCIDEQNGVIFHKEYKQFTMYQL